MKKDSAKNNLLLFQNKLNTVITLSLVLSFILLIILSIIAYIFNNDLKYKSYVNDVNSANQVLQYNISSQLMIIINSSDFIRFMRSGSATREIKYTNIQWVFAKLKNNTIQGMSIKNKYDKEIFSYGKVSSLFASLKLCYFGNVYDSKLGTCSGKMTVYFDKKKYIDQLHLINPSINFDISRKNNYILNIFGNTFGLFKVDDKTQNIYTIKLNIKSNSELIFALFIIAISLLYIFSFYLSHKYLNKLVKKNLILPLQYIKNGYTNNNILLNINNKFLSELNDLVHIINIYNDKAVSHRLDILTEELAHKLNNPLNGIMTIMPKLIELNKNNNQVQLLERYVHTIYNLTSNILDNFRTKTANFFNDDKNTDKYIRMEQIIEQIYNDFQNSKPNCKYILNVESKHTWIYTTLINLEDVIVNLLNNAFDSLKDIKSKSISISTNRIENYYRLIISDSGCGIPDNELSKVLKGKSLKHPGKGIGLQSAIQYIKGLGGDLSISSTINLGTIITIKIPISEKPIWLSECVKYQDRSIFVIIGKTSTITNCQKYLSFLDNKKLYFTNFQDFKITLSKLNMNDNDIIFIFDEQFIEDISNENYKSINFVIIHDQLLSTSQQILSTNKNFHAILYENIDENLFIYTT